MAITWQEADGKHYDSAAEYLSLLWGKNKVQDIVNALKLADIDKYRAEDVLRASRLSLLPPDEPRVAKNLKMLKKGQAIEPILLVKGKRLIIANGYHRICAAYIFSPAEQMQCKIVKGG